MEHKISYSMCGAKTRAGGSCRQPAMKNGRCYYHGGASLSGKQHGRYRTGYWTKEAVVRRRALRDLMRMVDELIMKNSYTQPLDKM